jgi:hypothetical protein
VFRRRDALGRYFAYGQVRHALRALGVELPIACACCGYLTSGEFGYGFCGLCRWFHDAQDDPDADSAHPGPNHVHSLTQARALFADRLCVFDETDRDFAIEQVLVERKRPIIDLFDRMAGAMDGEQFVDALVEAKAQLKELSAERNRLLQQRIGELSSSDSTLQRNDAVERAAGATNQDDPQDVQR